MDATEIMKALSGVANEYVDKLEDIKSNELNNLIEKNETFPGLAPTKKQTLQVMPSYFDSLYGSEKKIREAITFILSRSEGKNTTAWRKHKHLLAFELLFGESTRAIEETEQKIPLEQLCMHMPAHRVLDRYCKKYFQQSLPEINEKAEEDGITGFLQGEKFSTSLAEIVYKSQIFFPLDAAYLILDKALHDLYFTDPSRDRVIDSAQAIHTISVITNTPWLTVAITACSDRYPELESSRPGGMCAEDLGYTPQLGYTDCLLVGIKALAAGAGRRNLNEGMNNAFWSSIFNPKLVKEITENLNNRLIISTIYQLDGNSIVLPDHIKNKDKSDPIVKSLISISEAVKEASSLGINCEPFFSSLFYSDQAQYNIDYSYINEEIKKAKAELASLAKNIEAPSTIDKITEVGKKVQNQLSLQADGATEVAEELSQVALDIQSEIDKKKAVVEIVPETPIPEEQPTASEMTEYLETEVSRLEKELDQAKAENNSLQNTITSLQHKSGPAITEEASGKTSYAAFRRTLKKQLTLPEVIEWAQDYYEGRLIFHPAAIKEARLFTDCTRFGNITDRFERLGGDFYEQVSSGSSIHDARSCLGNDFCTDLALRVKNSKGITNKRTFEYNGEDVLCAQYLRIGKDFRIYFAPVKTKTGIQLLIGYIGEKMQKS